MVRFFLPNSSRAKSEEALIASLYQQIGQLKVEVDFLKKTVRARGPTERHSPIAPQAKLSRSLDDDESESV